MKIIQSTKKRINKKEKEKKEEIKKIEEGQFIKLPFIIKSKIFRLLNQYDSFQLYKTCKYLNQIKYITIESIECSEENYEQLIESRLIERTKEIETTYAMFKVIIDELENNNKYSMLESFKLYSYDGESIIDVYPKYLTKLVLDFEETTTLVPLLPDTIEDLELYVCTDTILDHKLLPRNLKRLHAPLCTIDQFVWHATMTDLYLQEIDWSLPFPSKIDTVTINKLTINSTITRGFKFPSTITSLSCVSMGSTSILFLEIECLPNNLEYLYLDCLVFGFSNDPYNLQSTIHQLPTTLTHLINFNYPPNQINFNQLVNLKVLVFDDTFNNVIPSNSLPPSIKELTIGVQFNHPLTANMIPPQLEILTHRSSVQLPKLPTSLKELYFYIYNQPIHQMELESTQLTTINFGVCFDHPIRSLRGRSYFPPTLCHLTVGPKFHQSLKSIPLSVVYNVIS